MENCGIISEENLAKKIVSVMDSKKAEDIKLLKVSEKTVIADYFVICSGNSNTQVKGICDEIEYKLGLDGVHPLRVDGLDTCLWGVMDYNSVMVHVFSRDSRKFYNLERLWAEAEEIDISSVVTEN